MTDSKQLNLQYLRKRASQLSKKLSIPKKDALNRIAVEQNFENWSDLLASVKDTSNSKEKLTVNDLFYKDSDIDLDEDDENYYLKFKGVTKNANGGIQIDRKLSFINYTSRQLNSYKSFKNLLDKDLKKLHRQYPNVFAHVIKFYVNPSVFLIVDSPDKLVKQIIKRHPWVSYLLLCIEPFNPEDAVLDPLHGLPEEIQEIFTNLDGSEGDFSAVDFLNRTTGEVIKHTKEDFE